MPSVRVAVHSEAPAAVRRGRDALVISEKFDERIFVTEAAHMGDRFERVVGVQKQCLDMPQPRADDAALEVTAEFAAVKPGEMIAGIAEMRGDLRHGERPGGIETQIFAQLVCGTVAAFTLGACLYQKARQLKLCEPHVGQREVEYLTQLLFGVGGHFPFYRKLPCGDIGSVKVEPVKRGGAAVLFTVPAVLAVR